MLTTLPCAQFCRSVASARYMGVPQTRLLSIVRISRHHLALLIWIESYDAAARYAGIRAGMDLIRPDAQDWQNLPSLTGSIEKTRSDL